MKKVAFFPGKFQPPHIGHVLTISKLMKKYHVIIGISPDDPRVISQKEVKCIFETIFGDRADYFIFDYMLTTYRQIDDFPKFDVILTGNDQVINWAKKLKLKVKKIPRSKCIGGSGTELRRLL
jgi:nicotinamide mononucleotide adenylyltransferase